MGVTDRVKARAKHPTGGAVTGRIAAHDPRKHARVNQAAGWVGHEKRVHGTSIEDARAHNSAPLSTLKDPSAFGPPPKHVNYNGETAASATSSPATSNAPALPASSKPAVSKPAPQISTTSGGLGAPLPKALILSKEEKEEQLAAEEAAKPPPMPYRTDTTGLTTDNLPKPPVRRMDSSELNETPTRAPRPVAVKPKPQPPPRLPARQNSNPTEFTPSPPPAYPASSATATAPESEPQAHQPAAPTSMSQLSELQSRFNKLPGRVSSPSPPAQPPRATNTQPQPTAFPAPSEQPNGQGTTWAQKQAALRTAGQFQQDPSSVSASDARAAAGTARDFHERHGEQVASGWQRAKAFDSKYGVRGKVGGLISPQAQAQAQEPAQQAASDEGGVAEMSVPPQPPASNGHNLAAAAAAAHKKPPPPPPPKKKALQELAPASGGGVDSGEAPPPIPLSSKPTR